VTPAVHLAVDTAAAAPGGTIVATWAGNPTPSASDYLRLFALGSAGDDFEDPFIGWKTPNAGAGQLALMMPTALAAGWYELRLLSPDPGSGLPVPIARSEPIRIDGTLAPPPQQPPPGAPCEDASVCDDGDPCTDDACVTGVGCVSTPVAGLGSVTCTCGWIAPAACAGEELPASIGGRRQRVCDLFTAAAGAGRRPLVVRRLRQAVHTLTGSIRVVTRGRRRSVSADCAGAVAGQLRAARDRAARLLATLPKA
jgi:hypothetical protein